MKPIYLLQNTIQEYEWGSRTAIAELMGRPSPAENPQAELWMGAHPKAPSMANVNGDWIPLKVLIDENPTGILGPKAAARFDRKLPYLFKVLAAAKALSIQAHPNLAQAKEGFTRENDIGIPMDAPHRNYKDDNHKPEIICALTTFWALNGFRAIEEIVANMHGGCRREMAVEINSLKNNPNSAGLQEFFEAMMTMEPDRKNRVIKEVLQFAHQRSDEDSLAKWILLLSQEYPTDIGILSPLYLNLVKLSPGEAMFLPAGQLHAYLEGLGMELMANSDNVLRGGLTPKHVDVPELLKTLSFEGQEVEKLSAKEIRTGELAYFTPAKEFVLSVITMNEAMTYRSATDRAVEILFCTDGEVAIVDLHTDKATVLERGASAMVPAALERYSITGSGTLYKASVPI
jgi:mannose-6-phosphate isomerase